MVSSLLSRLSPLASRLTSTPTSSRPLSTFTLCLYFHLSFPSTYNITTTPPPPLFRSVSHCAFRVSFDVSVRPTHPLCDSVITPLFRDCDRDRLCNLCRCELARTYPQPCVSVRCSVFGVRLCFMSISVLCLGLLSWTVVCVCGTTIRLETATCRGELYVPENGCQC